MILRQKRVAIIIAVLTVILILADMSILKPESKNYKTYEQALSEYNNNNFSNAYYLFGRVTRFSELRPAAVFRQADCADKLGDTKTEIRKYKEVMSHYPNSILAIRAKYLKAQDYYKTKKYRKAEKEFRDVLNKYPGTDYSTASEYYLGAIESEEIPSIKKPEDKLKTQYKAIEHFKLYLKEAPTGRLAFNCISKWLSLNTKLSNEDNLLIGKAYQANGKYNEAEKYLRFTSLNLSWPYLVKNYYELGDYSKVKYYAEHGISLPPNDVSINRDLDEFNSDIYKAIDIYLKISPSAKDAISYLESIAPKANGNDYLLYKKCINLPDMAQAACFNSLYYHFPQGQFAAEALANIFYDKVKSQQYSQAKKLAKEHLSKFPQAKSTPKVLFWLARISEKTKQRNEANTYYKVLLRQFPDDYYAYRAYMNLNRFRHLNTRELTFRPAEFPYKNSRASFITALAKVKDYGLINQLYQYDPYIQSWLAYLQGDYSRSATIARDEVEELAIKPEASDPKWLLVYPIHYYNEVKNSAAKWNNDPILILSIIREESYFNPHAQSPVGARGLMQLMPSTAQEAANSKGISLPNISMLFSPDFNIDLGNIYYATLKKRLDFKDILAVLAYNGGAGSVSKWKNSLEYEDTDDFIEQIPYPETQNYLKKVYRSYWNYIRIYSNLRY